MKKNTFLRWICARTGLVALFLALALAPAPARAEQPPVPTLAIDGLRPTAVPDQWELLRSYDEGRSWEPVEVLEVVLELSLPEPPKEVTGVGSLESYGESVLVLRVPGAEAHSLGFAGPLLGIRSDGTGRPLRPFVETARGLPEDLAVRAAPELVELWDGTLAPPPLMPPHIDCGCEEACDNEYQNDLAVCAGITGACMAVALTDFLTCTLACGGVPVCEGLCVGRYLAAITLCTLNHVRCQLDAEHEHLECYDECIGDPGN